MKVVSKLRDRAERGRRRRRKRRQIMVWRRCGGLIC